MTDPCARYADCEQCAANDGRRSCGWCFASGSCVTALGRGGTCAWGYAERPALCEDALLATRTSLAVDCRRPDVNDVRCAAPRGEGAGSIGSGPDFAFATLGLNGGFVDASANALVLAVGAPTSSAPRATGVFVVDLATGNRSFVTGFLDDRLRGELRAGSGPEFPGALMDVDRGPDGRWYALSIYTPSTTSGLPAASSTVFRIDPSTGAREVVAQDSTASPLCSVSGSRSLGFGRFVPATGWTGMAPLVVGADGSLFSRLEATAERLFGVGSLRDGSCRVVSLYDSSGDRDIGSGPASADVYRSMTSIGGRLYATVGTNVDLLEIDPTTGNRRLISSADERVGRGPALLDEAIQASSDGRTIYMAGDGRDVPSGLLAVDVATGDRTALRVLGGPLTAGNTRAVFEHPTQRDVLVVLQPMSVALYETTTGNSVLLSY